MRIVKSVEAAGTHKLTSIVQRLEFMVSNHEMGVRLPLDVIDTFLVHFSVWMELNTQDQEFSAMTNDRFHNVNRLIHFFGIQYTQTSQCVYSICYLFYGYRRCLFR